MRTWAFVCVIGACALTSTALARSMASDVERSEYLETWKLAAPEAFAQPVSRWLRFVPDNYVQGEANCIEYITSHGGRPFRSCELYEIAPGRLVTRCDSVGKAVIGLYDAKTQHKLDELTLRAHSYGEVRFRHLSSRARWDLASYRGGSSDLVTYYGVVADKLVPVATIDAHFRVGTLERLEQHVTDSNRLAARDPGAFSYVRSEFYDDTVESTDESIRVAGASAIDADGDGLNERIELTSIELRLVDGLIVRVNSPRVTRTLIWNPSTLRYDD